MYLLNTVNLLTEHAKGNSHATYVIACAIRLMDIHANENVTAAKIQFGDYLYRCLDNLNGGKKP